MVSKLVRDVRELLRSTSGGLNAKDEPGPSLVTLSVRDDLPRIGTVIANPFTACVLSSLLCRFSIEETSLDGVGLFLEVPLGVGDALSALAFLDPDLGVMFELRNDLTGVATFSLVNSGPFLLTLAPPFPDSWTMWVTGEAAAFGNEERLPYL